ncbi:MAG: glycosyltransferase family A protein [Microcoleaceae cyanobacterium]
MNSIEKIKFISVIVPVYNNIKPLETCLDSLQNQTHPKDFYEVIVVDNASEENIGSIANKFSQVTLTYESKPGSYAARNKGILIAKGEIMAFTDSDCIPAENWIEKGLEKLLQVPNCGLVAGKIELFFQIPDQPTAIEFYDAITYLDQKQHVNRSKFGATANMFTFASRFKSVGLFNDELKSGGDMEWGRRVSSQGYEIIYAEEAYIKHPARSSLGQLYKTRTRIVGGHYTLGKDYIDSDIQEKEGQNLVKEILQRLKPPVKYLRWRLSDQRLKGNKQKLLFIVVTIFIDYAIAWELLRLGMGGKPKKD